MSFCKENFIFLLALLSPLRGASSSFWLCSSEVQRPTANGSFLTLVVKQLMLMNKPSAVVGEPALMGTPGWLLKWNKNSLRRWIVAFSLICFANKNFCMLEIKKISEAPSTCVYVCIYVCMYVYSEYLVCVESKGREWMCRGYVLDQYIPNELSFLIRFNRFMRMKGIMKSRNLFLKLKNF